MVGTTGIQRTRGAARRLGIRLGKDTKEITLADNTFTGLMKDVEQV